MVLITGGLGYLGARIAYSLLEDGYKVRIASSREKPSFPTELNKCEIVQIDLKNQSSIDKVCIGVNAIIHLASLNHSESEKNPIEAKNINSHGTLKMLNSAKKNNVDKFLYFSTMHVYGGNLHGTINEDSEVCPINQYSLTHKLAEDYVIRSNSKNKFNTCIFRLTNVVGSPLDPSANCWTLVANDLCKKIATNQKAELHSNKTTKRDFIAMSNIIEAVKFYLNDSNSYKYGGEVINISSGNSISLEQICKVFVSRAEKVLGKKVEIKFKNENNQSNDFCISNKKAQLLGIKFCNGLEHEVDQMLLNYKNWFNTSELT